MVLISRKELNNTPIPFNPRHFPRLDVEAKLVHVYSRERSESYLKFYNVTTAVNNVSKSRHI